MVPSQIPLFTLASLLAATAVASTALFGVPVAAAPVAHVVAPKIATAAVNQDARELSVRIKFDSGLVKQVQPRVCLLARRGGSTPKFRICANNIAGKRIRIDRANLVDGKPRGAVVKVSGKASKVKRGVAFRLPLDQSGLPTPSRLRWQIESQAGNCQASDVCEFVWPSGKSRSLALHEPRVAGCTANPPWQVRNGSGGRKRVALTFDDGPSSYTPQVLKILEHANVHATFFVLGVQLGGRSELLKQMLRSGNSIGNHTVSHANVSGGGSGQIVPVQHSVNSITGFTPCVFRPPGGATSGTLVDQLRGLGLVDVLWNVDTNDWRGRSAGEISATAKSGGPGSIVLMHDGGGVRSPTVSALPGIIASYKSRGYELVTVEELLNLPQRWE